MKVTVVSLALAALGYERGFLRADRPALGRAAAPVA
jgi:hypothetical protein